MTAQAATKSTIPVGSDAWNLTAHIKQAVETTRVIIPVTNQAERDGLAALFPGGAVPQGTAACRLDRKSSLDVWSGTAWIPGPLGQLSNVTNAGSNVVGIALNNLLEVSPTVEAGRLIELRATIDGATTVTGGVNNMYVSYTLAYGGTGTGGTPLRTSTKLYAAIGNGEGFEITARFTTATAGSLRFNLQGQVTVPSTGAQTMTATAGNTRLTVTDLGPA
jgi:hypothetical protein